MDRAIQQWKQAFLPHQSTTERGRPPKDENGTFIIPTGSAGPLVEVDKSAGLYRLPADRTVRGPAGYSVGPDETGALGPSWTVSAPMMPGYAR